MKMTKRCQNGADVLVGWWIVRVLKKLVNLPIRKGFNIRVS